MLDQYCQTCEHHTASCVCPLGPSLDLNGPVYPTPCHDAACRAGYVADFDARGWYRIRPLTAAELGGNDDD